MSHRSLELLGTARRRLRQRAVAATVAGLTASAACTAHADAQIRAGNVLAVLMPAATLGVELWNGDAPGARQFATSFTVSMAATAVLKRSTHVERPDHSDDRSFPSGHATLAFASATYVHRRHGLESAWPLYLAATYVGYTRVDADKHRWRDVAGSAALSAVSSWWLVDPKPASSLSVVPAFEPGYVGVQVRAAW